MEEEYTGRDSRDVKPLKDRILEDSLYWTVDDNVDDETMDFLERVRMDYISSQFPWCLTLIQMLEKNPKDRLKIGLEIPNHPYFARV